jgi:Type IV secretion-system coupling protein DNA-binding domain
MGDLIPYQNNAFETREEAFSRQFYEWEKRGRGWTVFDVPVELEPPFLPLYFFNVGQTAVDDGRRESFFGKLFGSSKNEALALQNKQLAEYEQYVTESNEPDICSYYTREFTELRLVLPKDLNATKIIAENLILSFSYATHPISFEVIGSSREIVIQIAATEIDASHIKQQIKSHLPSCVIVESTDYLSETWTNGDDESLIVDFGLSNEFMLPLNTSGNHFENDILTTIVGALSNLESGEVGVFQVLFQKAKQNWSEEIINSVRYFDGTPFFSNAPEIIPLAKEKIGSQLFVAVVRIASKSDYHDRTMQIVRSIGASLVNLSSSTGNELIPLSNDGYLEHQHEQSLLNRMSYRSGMILNSDELVSLVHPPTSKVLSDKLIRESEKTKVAPSLVWNNELILGQNLHQNKSQEVSLSNEQRTKHLHLIGSSGSGKSTLLLNLIKQDLVNNQGLCVIDPHGDLIDEVISNVPNERLKDVILFDPSDEQFPIGFNILQANSELEKNLLSSDLVATFRRMSTSWGDVMDSVLANSILAFVESTKGGTLFDLRRFLVEKDFRSEFLKTVSDESVKYFWTHEFPNITGKPQSSILIRLDSFMRNKLVRNIVCQKHTTLDFRKVMDSKKVLLIKLSQGLIGEENAYLLGTLLVSKLYQTALSRQDSQNRPYFWLYMDEFQHFITPSMESILSGVRKYNIGLHLAHQEFRQLQSRSLEVASSVLSTRGFVSGLAIMTLKSLLRAFRSLTARRYKISA